MHRKHVGGGARIRISSFALVIGLGLLLCPRKAHAYLDPGTGSLIIQIIAGAFLAIAMTFKLWRWRVKKLITKLFRLGKKDAE
jgi:O-antigen/teichoic acid export membrane protein